MTLPFVDVFAGAGGLSLGLAAAGFTPVLAVERDRDAAVTYAGLHPGARVERADVADVTGGPWAGGRVALLAGGPPCQPYSVGGYRRGATDPRDGLPAFARAVRVLGPDAFLLENVPGAVVAAGQLMADMQTLGYHVTWRLVRCAQHGVPQTRRRLLMVGTRRPGFRFPDPTHGLPGLPPPVPAYAVIDPAHPAGDPPAAKVTYAARPDLRRSPYGGHLFNGGGRPIDPAAPAPAVLASAGGNKTPWVDTGGLVPGYHRHLAAGGAPLAGVVPGARRLTVAECAALQGFPPATTFHGSVASQFRQVGNAVPVQVAADVGAALRAHLEAA